MGRGQCGETVHAHTNVIDTLEVTCTTGNRNRATGLSAYPPNHKTIRSRLKSEVKSVDSMAPLTQPEHFLMAGALETEEPAWLEGS